MGCLEKTPQIFKNFLFRIGEYAHLRWDSIYTYSEVKILEICVFFRDNSKQMDKQVFIFCFLKIDPMLKNPISPSPLSEY